MSLSVGIVGFPNVGKSTLFQTITKKQVACDNYPFCTIDPNVGIVSVYDERVDEIAQALSIDKRIYPAIEFIDIAGIVEGASQGKGLGNRFLSHIREVDLIVFVLRAFMGGQVVGVREEVDPVKEAELLETELILKDIETIDKKLSSLEKEIKGQRKGAFFESETLQKAKNFLEKGKLLIDSNFKEEENEIISQCFFLTFKPRIYLLNGKEEEVSEETRRKLGSRKFLIVDIKEGGSGAKKLIQEAYNLLDLITFFTIVGQKEVRAWKIKKGSKALQAGGIVHSDFQERFIKAMIIRWKDLIEAGNTSKAKKRFEGKNYIIQDGDVVEFRHG